MSDKMICQNCKAVIPQGSTFCPRCGTRISSIADPHNQTVSVVRPAASVYLPEGTVLQGKYKINHVIGQGGFGITYDGTDLKLQMHIAIKEYFPSQIADRSVSNSNQVTCTKSTIALYEHGMRNFRQEARNMAKFAGQPGFVSVHDSFSENNTAYIIMEYVEGQNLRDYMRLHGRLSMDAAMAIIIPVMDTLEKLHGDEMIHRDISPTNIMVLPDNRVKLLDFGAVRDFSPESQTLTTMSAVYKKGYSPIEQQTTDMEQGTYSDIYALCATLYEMLTGSLPPSPFLRIAGTGQLIPPSSMGVQIQPSQEKGLMKGLEVYPKDRIQTIPELRDALSRDTSSGIGTLSEKPENTALLKILTGAAAIILIILVFQLIKIFFSERQSSTAQSTDTGSNSSADTAQSDSERQPDDQSLIKSQPAEDQDSEAVTEEDAQDTDIVPEEEEQYADTAEEEEQYTDEAIEEAQEIYYDYPEGALSYGGHHYYIFDDIECSFDEALVFCLERNGYLAVINDSAENEVLYKYMTDLGHEQAFFGLTFRDGTWDYLAGDTSDFRNWGYNSKNIAQPNNADEKLFDVSLDTNMHDGHWSDNKLGAQTYTSGGRRYNDIYTFICEWDG